MQPCINHSPLEEQIWQQLLPTAQAMNLELVRVRMLNAGDSTSPFALEIMLERLDTTAGGVTLDECAEASRRFGRILDVFDPLPEQYRLEVSSPGIERPLCTPAALQTQVGQLVKVALKAPIDNKKRLQGTLTSVAADSLVLSNKTVGSLTLRFDAIKDVSRILDDEAKQNLLKKSSKK